MFSNDAVHKQILQKEDIALIPVGSHYSIEVRKASHLLTCRFSDDTRLCNRIHQLCIVGAFWGMGRVTMAFTGSIYPLCTLIGEVEDD